MKFCEHQFEKSECIHCGFKCDGKNDTEKIDWTLLPWEALEEAVKVFMMGAKKYEDYSWSKVPDGQKRYWAAIQRHMKERFLGREKDSESGLNPVAHIICDALILLSLDMNKGVSPINETLETLSEERS